MEDFHSAISRNLKNNNLIIDHVLEKESWYETCKNTLKDKNVCWVDIRCNLDILKRREASRGNRKIGLAERLID